MICKICGINDRIIRHHISYNPEITISLCNYCHPKLHAKIRLLVSCLYLGYDVVDDIILFYPYYHPIKDYIREIYVDKMFMFDIINMKEEKDLKILISNFTGC